MGMRDQRLLYSLLLLTSVSSSVKNTPELQLGASLEGVGVGEAEASGFLFVSSPQFSQVSWLALPAEAHRHKPSHYKASQVLISSGLSHPQGLAYDSSRHRLYIADPDVKTVLMYEVNIDKTPEVKSGPYSVAEGMESRWVSVDGDGDIIFSDEPANMILKVAADDVGKGLAPEVLFNGGEMVQVSEPGGVAVDGSGGIYWTNKAFGHLAGSLIHGLKASKEINVMAKNSEKCYGVCVANGHVYFTDAERRLFGVATAKNGQSPHQVSEKLTNPRGCVADQGGRVFLADRGAGAVYSFMSPGMTLLDEGASQKSMVRLFDHEDAFGIALVQKQSLMGGLMSASDGVQNVGCGVLGGEACSTALRRACSPWVVQLGLLPVCSSRPQLSAAPL
eukprot:TRINITY_DN64086_c0_g1_i1.p1 TRINITY_DN64086_c0_g1~~TRINITY_DN64086_c0_g1_i1.p1  ORF type:complete len:391 (-),score=64.59 TRINITY_DN64086_c0_g1_i1:52-1224(-)